MSFSNTLLPGTVITDPQGQANCPDVPATGVSDSQSHTPSSSEDPSSQLGSTTHSRAPDSQSRSFAPSGDPSSQLGSTTPL
ncbi:hypothetical protein RCL1_008188 [Eukaryota sp. TZLM3-RCL]